MQDYTVDIDGGDAWEGEKPFTYCVCADGMDEAKRKAFAFFLADMEWDAPGSKAIDWREGAPASDVPYHWNDCRERGPLHPQWFEVHAAEIAQQNPRHAIEVWADGYAYSGDRLDAALCSRALEIQAEWRGDTTKA